MQKKSLILIILLIITFFGFFTYAQVRDTDIVLSISPEYPSPNQDVNATLNSYVLDLNKANISWSVNSQELSIGIGKKSFSFRVGDNKSSIVLSVTIDTIDGQSILKTLTMKPAGVDMLWEAYDSYVPPFYKGKALVSSQGIFKVVAIPSLINQSGQVNINNLSYVWTKDGSVYSDSSGWGKNYLIFQNSYLDKGNSVSVKISDISGGANASGRITLRTVNPKVIFYENDPLLGTKWEIALNNGVTINPKGETLVAEPYFFSPNNIDSSKLSFDWSINGEKTETPNFKNVLSVKPEAGQSGNAIIKVIVNNTQTLFQSIEKQIQISF